MRVLLGIGELLGQVSQLIVARDLLDVARASLLHGIQANSLTTGCCQERLDLQPSSFPSNEYSPDADMASQ